MSCRGQSLTHKRNGILTYVTTWVKTGCPGNKTDAKEQIPRRSTREVFRTDVFVEMENSTEVSGGWEEQRGELMGTEFQSG